MTIISYAQNAEDVLIHRFFADEGPQYYVDVGAAHPVYHSVTKHFYDLGWRGLNLEPRPDYCDLLKADRPEDETLNCAVSNSRRTTTFFEVTATAVVSDDNGGLSTLDESLIADYRERGFDVNERELEVLTLSEILETRGVTDIGFLKIDVEGHEPEVVAGMDWLRWRPRLVILEGTQPMSSELADSTPVDRILEQGYLFAFFDGLNQFLVRKEDADKLPILSTPANVFDSYLRYEHLKEICQLQHEVKTTTEALRRKTEQLDNLFFELRDREEQLAALKPKVAKPRKWSLLRKAG